MHAGAPETTVLGVRLSWPVMNAPGTARTARDLEMLLAVGAGAVCLPPVTVHPFVHPGFRELHNPGHDRLLPLVRQLADRGPAPIVACVAGGTPEEFGFLARVCGEAGVALVQLHLASPWVEAALAPFDDLAVLERVCTRVREEATTPILAEVPTYSGGRYAEIGRVLADTGIGGVVVANEFTGIEKYLLEAGRRLEVVAQGNVESGWEIARTLTKGARAVQIDRLLRREGPRVLPRLRRELGAVRR